MNKKSTRASRRKLNLVVSSAMAVSMLQLPGCNLADDSFEISATLGAQDFVTFIVRSVVINPLEDFLVDGINNLIDEED